MHAHSNSHKDDGHSRQSDVFAFTLSVSAAISLVWGFPGKSLIFYVGKLHRRNVALPFLLVRLLSVSSDANTLFLLLLFREQIRKFDPLSSTSLCSLIFT